MSKQEKRNSPECGCRGCVNLRTGRLGKDDCIKLNASEKCSPRARIYSRVKGAPVECSCGCREQNVSDILDNHETFIKFTGPASGAGFNPAGSVLPRRNTSILSSSGCFLEKNPEGKQRAFDLQNIESVKAADGEYVRSVTVWKGVLVKRIYVGARRASHLRSGRVNNGFLPSENSHCCNDGPRATEMGSLSKNSKFYARPKVGPRNCF